MRSQLEMKGLHQAKRSHPPNPLIDHRGELPRPRDATEKSANERLTRSLGQRDQAKCSEALLSIENVSRGLWVSDWIFFSNPPGRDFAKKIACRARKVFRF